jgi:serine protease AprX
MGERIINPAIRRTVSGAAVALVAAGVMPAVAATGTHAKLVPVIVTGEPGATQQVKHDVTSVGGRIRSVLGVVDGVSATVPATSVAALRSAPGVRSVSADAHGHLMGIDPTLGYDVTNDEGSLYDVASIVHATNAWKSGYTGNGVDVALIDSGVSPVQGLTSGNVVNGPDLSFESQDPDLAHLDTFGHGTHMASIIAGRDQAASGATYASSSSHQFVGIAPDARIVNVKVGSADGGADVSQVIAAIDWVTEHAQSGDLNIKVLNLSYGTDSTQSVTLDPLDYAVENAWRSGITVVVAAGNDGTNRQELADPANDPLVIAVGADDPHGTNNVADDTIPAFSQRGTSTRHVDLIAPGVHILGLRDPGSSIDQANPSAVVNNRFFRGSGTSQATAVVSGLAALYLSKYPNATPNQVKYALTQNATPPTSTNKLYTGLGVPFIDKALGQKPGGPAQASTGATGKGTLEGARGTSHVQSGTQVLSGEQDIFGDSWNAVTWSTASAAGTAWNGGTYNGNSWSGSSWSGSSWSSETWAGNSWSGNDWAGNSWSGHSWSGHSWSSSGWDGNSWSDSAWAGNSWSTSTWAGSSWS